MATELPPQLQDQIAQLQSLQQQLTVTAQQRQQIEFQLRETKRAVEELDAVAEGATIYRSVGSLLVKATGRDTVKKQLQDEAETLEVRLKAFEKQEGRLREKATELQSKVQAGVKSLGGPARAPAGAKKPSA